MQKQAYRMNWWPLWVTLFFLGVMAWSSLTHANEPVPTQAQRDAQAQAQFEKNEAFHCQLTGHPSDEARLAGYECP